MFGAFAMSMSSFCVVSNALRLNLFDIRSSRKDTVHGKRKRSEEIFLEKTIESEEKKMVKKMVIEGMMCGHCEAAVKKALEVLPQVSQAEVSHESNTAVVTLQEELSDEVLKKTVEEKDYTVISIE